MTLNHLLSQVGIGTKQISERYSEYGTSGDQHIYYTYEPSSSGHGHAPVYKQSYGGGLKTNASMSALTLLAFLFFLHILQQCIKEHMNDMNSAPVMVMTAGRDSEDDLLRTATKIDKTGLKVIRDRDLESDKNEGNKKIKVNEGVYDIKNPYDHTDTMNKNHLTKINVAEYTPKIDKQKYEYVYKSYANRSSMFPEFVTVGESK